MKIKPDGKDALARTRLQPVEWLEHGPFTVEVTGRVETAGQPNLERNQYVNLDIRVLDHCSAGSLAWLCGHRRDSRVDC